MLDAQRTDNDTSAEITPENNKAKTKSPTSKRFFYYGLSIGAAILILVTCAWLGRGLFVAAVVNGTPISRLSVVSSLEKQSGKTALESLIRKKLIDDETRKKNVTVTDDEIGKELKQIEAQVASQGGTLEDALNAQGMTINQLREQIEIQKKIEKLLGDSVSVSNEEVEAYISENKIELPKDKQPEEAKAALKEQLKQQKFQQAAQKWVSDLTKNAKIQYYVNY